MKNITIKLTVPGKPFYGTLQEVVNKYIANRFTFIKIVEQHKRDLEIQASKYRHIPGTFMGTLKPLKCPDGYIILPSWLKHAGGEEIVFACIKECSIAQRYDHLTLSTIYVDGQKKPTYSFFTDDFLDAWQSSDGKDIGSLLRTNMTIGYHQSRIQTKTSIGEARWIFHGGLAVGRIEDGYCVFHKLHYSSVYSIKGLPETAWDDLFQDAWNLY